MNVGQLDFEKSDEKDVKEEPKDVEKPVLVLKGLKAKLDAKLLLDDPRGIKRVFHEFPLRLPPRKFKGKGNIVQADI